jgi:adenylate cyclase
MGIEIERKFLVSGSDWRDSDPVYFCQGYLNADKFRTVRVRVAGGEGFLTIKGPTSGASRFEFEYSIPVDDARELFKLCDGPLIEKHRRFIDYGGLTWEVDEFLGENEGLIVAEVELQSEDQVLDLPSWIGVEVTGDQRYYNSSLCRTPFKVWR